MGRTYCEHLTPEDMDCPECDAVMRSAWDIKVDQIKKEERERIIKVLLATNPVTLEDRSYQGNPFSGTMLIFLESELRSALEPK